MTRRTRPVAALATGILTRFIAHFAAPEERAPPGRTRPEEHQCHQDVGQSGRADGGRQPDERAEHRGAGEQRRGTAGVLHVQPRQDMEAPGHLRRVLRPVAVLRRVRQPLHDLPLREPPGLRAGEASVDGGKTFTLVGNADGRGALPAAPHATRGGGFADQPTITSGARSVWVTYTAGDSHIIAAGRR